MQKGEFEKEVQQKMDELKFVPADAVWEKIEASLPEKERSKRWIFFILLFAGLITASAVLWNTLKNTDKNIASKQTITKEDAAKNTISIKKNTNAGNIENAVTKNKNEVKEDTVKNSDKQNEQKIATVHQTSNDTNAEAIATSEKKKRNGHSSTKIKIKNSHPNAATEESENDIVKTNNKPGIIKGKTKVTVKQPIAGEEEDDELIVADAKDTMMADRINIDSIMTAIKIKQIDSLSEAKNDTLKTAVKKEEKKKANSKWQYGIDIAAGSSSVKSDLLSSKSLYPGAFNNSSPGTGGGGQVISTPSKPSSGKSISIGLYAEREFAAKWKFKTGLNYSYQSNKIKTGQKVDTSINVIFDNNNRVIVQSYYRLGNAVTYTNKFHLIELPLLLQFKPSPEFPVYFEGGPAIGYLIGSDALIYSVNNGSYFTDKKVFNKLLFSFRAGVAFDFAKRSKLPFSIGYQFKYAINSVTKPVFANQHFVNSLIYLKIQLKK